MILSDITTTGDANEDGIISGRGTSNAIDEIENEILSATMTVLDPMGVAIASYSISQLRGFNNFNLNIDFENQQILANGGAEEFSVTNGLYGLNVGLAREDQSSGELWQLTSQTSPDEIVLSRIADGEATITSVATSNLGSSEFIVDAPTETIIYTPITALVTTEGESTSFAVRLTSQPESNETVSLSLAADEAEGTLSTNSLSFTSDNWDVYQTVIITGVEDGIVDGNITYSLDIATDSDNNTSAYIGGDESTLLSVTNQDIDSDTENDSLPSTSSEDIIASSQIIGNVTSLTEDSGDSFELGISLTEAPLNDIEVRYGINGGTAISGEDFLPIAAFVELTEANNPLFEATEVIDGGGTIYSAPTLVDIDGDGDQDAFVETDEEVYFFENEGTPNNPEFDSSSARKTTNLSQLDSLLSINSSVLSFADLDGDDDLDAIIGDATSLRAPRLAVLKNITGEDSDPGSFDFFFQIDNNASVALSGLEVEVPLQIYPNLVDIDGDGNLEAFIFVGDNSSGEILYYEVMTGMKTWICLLSMPLGLQLTTKI